MTDVILDETIEQIADILQDAIKRISEQGNNSAYVNNLLKTIVKQGTQITNLENQLENYKLQTTIQAQAIDDLEKKLRNK
jgi:hypothetical protein